MLLEAPDKNLTNRTAVIVVSDLHVNSTVAICPPVVNLDDGGTYHASKTQRWLWSCWGDFWARVNKEADGYRKVLVINGDLGELDAKDRSAQVITVNKSTILQMVRDVLVPAEWDVLYIVRGTRAHEGKSAWLAESIAADMDKCIPQDTGIHSWWQIRADVHGTKFDIAHHASMGTTPWTRVNSAVKLASKSLWDYAVDRGAKPPDIIVRAHNHIFAEASVNNTRAYFTPAWCMTTEYGYRIGQENTLANVGGLVFYCAGEHCFTEKYFYTAERERKVWQMKL